MPDGRLTVPTVGADEPFALGSLGTADSAGPARRQPMSVVRIPPVLRGEGRRQQAGGGGRRDGRRGPDGARPAVSGPQLAAPHRRRRAEPVRQRVPQRPGHPLPPGARHAGRGPGHADHPAGDGRRRGAPDVVALREAGSATWQDATRTSSTPIGHTPLVEIARMSPMPGGPDLREARDGEPDRVGEGSRREVPDRGPRAARRPRPRTR